MNLKTPLCPHVNKGSSLRMSATLAGVVVGVAMLLLLIMQRSWGIAVEAICIFYTVATVLFFLAQIWGFISAQTKYYAEVEAPKFKMLEEEEMQWRGYVDQ